MRPLAALLFVACGASTPTPQGSNPPPAPAPEPPVTKPTSDLDGDGFAWPEDCDDDDPAQHPDAPDVWYDGVDANCDYANDYDADRDGHGAIAYWGDDCDDADPSRSPSAARICGNGVDDDCDTRSDCDLRGEGFAEDLAVGVFTGTPGSDAGYWLDAGDVDGDGNPDVVVAGARADLAFLFKGPLVGTIRDAASADAQLPGGAAGATMGDFDGDGLQDVAASSQGLFILATTRVWSGNQFDPDAPSAQLVHALGDGESNRVAGADLNGDGVDDLLIGGLWGCNVPGWEGVPGCIEVFAGPIQGVFDDAAVTTMILAEGDEYVSSAPGSTGLDGSHDLTGDGVADLAICDSLFDLQGKFYVVESPLPSVVYLADAPMWMVPTDALTFATAVTTGDLDADGSPDLVLATKGANAGFPGSAWVFRGPLSPGALDPASAAATITPAYALTPTAADILGDFDGDGVQDLGLSYHDPDAAVDEAVLSVRLYYAPEGAAVPDFVLRDTAWGPSGLAAIGDVNGDGLDDLLAGSPGVLDPTGANAGGAYLILGLATGY